MAGPGPGGEEAKEEAETHSRARRGVNQTRMEFQCSAGIVAQGLLRPGFGKVPAASGGVVVVLESR